MTEQHNHSDKNGKTRFTIGSLNLEEIKSAVKKDFQDLKDFYLEPERVARLQKMGRFQRWFFMTIWLAKSLFLKLTPIRRLLVIISLVLILPTIDFTFESVNIHFTSNLKIVGGLMLLFVLALELKDKLVAKDELAAGRSLQLALLPGAKPNIPGWDVWLYSRPANDVGGDLIDHLQIADHRHALSLGDVSGKGLPAALLMSKLQATIRALANECETMTNLGHCINNIFHRDGVSQSFASLVYLELEEDRGEISLLNAGHPPPLYWQEGSLKQLSKGNMALGLKKETEFGVQSLKLQAGEYLIIYSDGVTEAQNGEGEFYELNRLKEVIKSKAQRSAQQLGQKILKEVKEFIGETPVYDDLSIIILKRQ
jgi:hypothetical protein